VIKYAILLIPSLALADAPKPASPISEVSQRLEAIASKGAHATLTAPAFAFTDSLTIAKPASGDAAQTGLPEVAVADASKTIVASADENTAWIATHLGEHYAACGKAGCAKEPPDAWLRATALFEKVDGTWQPTAWAITPPIPSASQQDAIDQGIAPDKIASDGSADAAKLFADSLVDPKKFAASFSDRKEVVMFGSELAERYVGKAAKTQVAAWNFAFTVRDGVASGTSKSGNVAWVAANVDAVPVKNAKAKPLPFRAFALYEKTGADWKLVSIQFSTAV